jgi:hypothetical protein
MASKPTTVLVSKMVTSRDGKVYNIPQVRVSIFEIDPEKVEISIKAPKKATPGTGNAKTAPAKPYFNIKYPHSDGRMYDLLITFKHTPKEIAAYQVDSYPPTEEDAMKQQHTIKVVQMTEEILAKMDAIHEKILDFVMENQQQILGNKTNKRREIIEEITRSVVKRDEDDEGNTYPPKMRIKVKFDSESGSPKVLAFRKEGQELKPLDFESIEDFKQEFNMTSEKVITMEPSFYVMGAQCGWTLALHSVLLGEKTVRQAQELPSFTADDLANLSDAPSAPKAEKDSTLQAEPEETEPEEEEEETNEPETAVIPSSDDEEETPAEEEEEEVVEEEEDEEEEEVPPPPKSTRKAPARRTARK